MNSRTLAISNHPVPHWQPANLHAIGRRFDRQHPRNVLRWALTTYAQEIALATGFGPSGIVLMHMVSELRPRTTIFYLQTDLLFPESMELRDELARRLGITFSEIRPDISLLDQARSHGYNLWQSDPDLCCKIRKVLPLRHFLSGKKAWITGIRRDQSPSRAGIRVVDWDGANELVKICPLAHWHRDQVWNYLLEHDLPYNPLHDQGYPSIGCMPCTRIADPGSDERAGRWAGSQKTECGIHVQPVDLQQAM
jgi:phosphoadenosine phosphosulfate reductase